MSKKDDMSIISLLARSKKRIKVLKSLEKEDKIPSRISKDIDDNSNHVSKYLKTLKGNVKEKMTLIDYIGLYNDPQIEALLNTIQAGYKIPGIHTMFSIKLQNIKNSS